MPRSESAERKRSRRLAAERAAYSPRNSGWYSRSKESRPTRLDLARVAEVAADVAGHVDAARRVLPHTTLGAGAQNVRHRAEGRLAAGADRSGVPSEAVGRRCSPQTATSETFCPRRSPPSPFHEGRHRTPHVPGDAVEAASPGAGARPPGGRAPGAPPCVRDFWHVANRHATSCARAGRRALARRVPRAWRSRRSAPPDALQVGQEVAVEPG
jgi:hypothetical protein